MTTYYLDTSALVKRYVLEQGTNWVMSLIDPAIGHDVYTVRLTGPEMMAALFRKARTGQVSLIEAKRAAGSFRTDWQGQYQVVGVSVEVANRAMNLAENYGLRGYDAVHLAAALQLQDVRRARQSVPLIFVSADAAQLRVATTEGLPVEDPNRHT